MLAALLPIECPRCVRCARRMRLVNVVLSPGHSEKRIFECAKCGAAEVRLVADPLDSGELNRLTDNVRPPV
jgi:hypothetical protein